MKILNCLFFLPCFLFSACNNDSMIIESVPKTPGVVVDGGAGLTFTPEQLKLPGKKGIGYSLKETDENYQRNLKRIKELNVFWNYSWNYNYVAGQPSHVEFIPQTWGKFTPDDMLSAVKPFVESGDIKRIIGFNEPDAASQSNVTVEQALELWPALQSLKIPLGSPSPTSYTSNAEWIESFMMGVEERGYRVDYICVHTYPGPNAQTVKNLIQQIYDKYKKPIIITEFAPADWNAKNSPSENRYTEAQCLQFMKDILPWLEEQEYVYGYAWFPFDKSSPWGCCSALYNEDGSLTSLGKYYSEFTGNISGDGDTEEYPMLIEENFESADWAESWNEPIETTWLSREIDNEEIINGNGSLLMNKVTEGQRYSGIAQTVKVEPGKTYEYGFTGRLQTERGASGVYPDGKKIVMSIKKGNDKNKWLELLCESATNQKLKGEVTIPEGLNTVDISIWTSWANAYGYIDDVYFRPKGEGGNSVDIEDFEDGDSHHHTFDD